MLSLVYSSDATGVFQEGDLISLLMSSRATNKRIGLTGILLYREGRFIQVLEGPTEVVVDRFAVIKQDPRHGHVRVLMEEEVPTRRFPRWSMGYADLTDPLIHTIPGYSSFFDTGTTPAPLATAEHVAALLDHFRDDQPGSK